MAFQSSVFIFQGFGVPGELYTDSPFRVQSYILNSPSHPEYNIIGATCCTIVSEGNVEAGGTGIFAGFLVDPKDQALLGTLGGGSLAATLTVPNFTQVECLTMGSIVVTLPAAAAIGDVVIFNQTTGAISTITPSTALPGGSSYANAVVDYYTVPTGGGLAVITVTPQQNPYVAQ
jgi:hypothetical protein